MIGQVYEKINKLAEKWFLRTVLKLVGKPELDNYYENYYPKIKNAIHEMKVNGKDLLFHGATAAIIVGSQGESSSIQKGENPCCKRFFKDKNMGLGNSFQ